MKTDKNKWKNFVFLLLLGFTIYLCFRNYKLNSYIRQLPDSSVIGIPPFASRQIQGDHSRSAKALFPADDQAAGFQFVKRPHCHLPAPSEFRFSVLHSEVQADGSIRFDVAFLFGNPRPV